MGEQVRMNLFLAYIQLNMKIMFQYRKSFLISAIIHPMELVISVMIFTSIYHNSGTDSIHGYSLAQMIWYLGGMQIVGTIIWNFTDSRLSSQVLDGSLAVQLLKPASIFQFELANAIALRTVGILFEFIPILIVQSLVFFPNFLTPLSIAKFAVAAAMSFCLFFVMNFLIGTFAFWLKNVRSLGTIKFIFVAFTGGSIIPIEFFPDWLKQVTYFLPFRYLYYEPLQFFLNREAAQSIGYFLKTVCMQLFWVVLLYAVGRLLWKRAIKRFCAVGG